MIPKILHQTGPTNSSRWHPLWSKCRDSWAKNFGDFEYRFWNDEDLDRLVYDHYPEYWHMYQAFPIHIMRIDFARLCMLDLYGGIYADLDYYCYQDFHKDLTHQAYLVENPNGNDPIENSLMCSTPDNGFFRYCMDLARQRFENAQQNHPELVAAIKTMAEDRDQGLLIRPLLIFYISGTNLVTSAWRKKHQEFDVGLLDGKIYNNHCLAYDSKFITKHVHTHLWGQENIDLLLDLANRLPTHHVGQHVDDFDFYRDYTNGEYLDLYKVAWDSNDIDDELSPEMSYGS